MRLLDEIEDTEEARHSLTFESTGFTGTQVLRCYSELPGGRLLVPKNYKRPELEDADVGAPTTENFTSELKDYQHSPARKIYSQVISTGAALAHLYTGFGKTVVALWLIAALKPEKTLIFVHKRTLESQWLAQIRAFLHDPTGVKVSTVQRQLNHMSELSEHADQCLMIFDEVHHMCARSFSRILWASSSQWHLGISATSKRPDGLEAVLHAFLGRPCVSLLSLRHRPLVCCSYYKEEGAIQLPMTRVNGKAVVNYNAALSMLCESQARNAHIMGILQKLGSRNTLVLTRRRAHAECLFGLAKDIVGRDVRMLLGGMSGGNVACAVAPGSSIILVATTQAAGEGFDMPILDTLVFATPSSDVTQETGRILRKVGPNTPLVVDIIDNAGLYWSQFSKRKRFYKDQGLEMSDQILVD